MAIQKSQCIAIDKICKVRTSGLIKVENDVQVKNYGGMNMVGVLHKKERTFDEKETLIGHEGLSD